MARQQKQPHRANHGQGFPPVNPYLTPQLRPPSTPPSRPSSTWFSAIPKVLGGLTRLVVIGAILVVVLRVALLGFETAQALWLGSDPVIQLGVLAMILITLTAMVKLTIKRI